MNQMRKKHLRLNAVKFFALLAFGASVSASSCDPDAMASMESYPGYTGEYEGFELVIDDRFDSFNKETWSKGDGTFGESKCRFQPQGVEIKDGRLRLIVREEVIHPSWSFDHNGIKPPRKYSCGELRSVDEFLYGRFETRMKNPHPSVATGYISSLFTYRNFEDEGYRWRELDIETEGLRPTKFQSNLIFGEGTKDWWQTREWGAFEEKTVIGPNYEWKVYALEWTPDAIRWFVDGKLVRELTLEFIEANTKATIPELHQQVMMNFWIPNENVSATFGGKTDGNAYPMVVEYDWFRYYRMIP